MKFTFIGGCVLKECSLSTLTAANIGEILNCKFEEINQFSFIFEHEGQAILDLTYIVNRPNGKIHLSPKSSDPSKILVALFDKDGKVFFPETWEQVTSWGL